MEPWFAAASLNALFGFVVQLRARRVKAESNAENKRHNTATTATTATAATTTRQNKSEIKLYLSNRIRNERVMHDQHAALRSYN